MSSLPSQGRMSHLLIKAKPEKNGNAPGRAILSILHNPLWYFVRIRIVFHSVKEIHCSVLLSFFFYNYIKIRKLILLFVSEAGQMLKELQLTSIYANLIVPKGKKKLLMIFLSLQTSYLRRSF